MGICHSSSNLNTKRKEKDKYDQNKQILSFPQANQKLGSPWQNSENINANNNIGSTKKQPKANVQIHLNTTQSAIIINSSEVQLNPPSPTQSRQSNVSQQKINNNNKDQIQLESIPFVQLLNEDKHGLTSNNLQQIKEQNQNILQQQQDDQWASIKLNFKNNLDDSLLQCEKKINDLPGLEPSENFAFNTNLDSAQIQSIPIGILQSYQNNEKNELTINELKLINGY